jgi:hypothetical protein
MKSWLARLQGRVLHAQGALGYFGLAKETTWGTAVAATDYAEILRENVSANFDRFAFKNVIFGLNEPDDSAGVLRIQGDVIMAAHPVAMGHLLKAAMNTVSGSVVGGGLFTTRFITTKSEFAQGVASQPYTLELHRDVGSAFQVAGAVCHQLALALTPNQDLRMTAGFIGKSVLLKAAGTPTFPSSSTYPFMFDTASFQIGGAATARLEALTVTINNGLEGIPALNNSNQVARIRRRNLQEVRVAGTLNWEDATEYLDFVNQTERAMVLSLTKASSFQFVIDMPRVVYSAFPQDNTGRERQTVQFAGMARYLPASAVAIDMRLTTTKSDY